MQLTSQPVALQSQTALNQLKTHPLVMIIPESASSLVETNAEGECAAKDGSDEHTVAARKGVIKGGGDL